MGAIFGHLNISDTDRVFATTPGQATIWQAVQDYLTAWNTELNNATALFVDTVTANFKERYKLPGGGYLQRRNSEGRYGTVKPTGQWDVAYPLEDFGASMGWNDVDIAYMTVQELERTVLTITAQSINTVRFEMLKALLNNTARTFVDPLNGSLTIQPLANGDSVVYPPVQGSDAEATETHYLESGYATASISDTNNPIKTIVDDLEEHFGVPTGGSNIAVMINNAETAKVTAITGFVPVSDRFVNPGDDTAVPTGLPSTLPGKVLGRLSGAWVLEWRRLPATYMVGTHLDVPKPLKQRIDPADTGLGVGLQLVATDDEFPFTQSFWRHRFGFGVGNRLNGVVMEMGTGGSYSIPTGYS